jgi:hypothetical protein
MVTAQEFTFASTAEKVLLRKAMSKKQIKDNDKMNRAVR